MNYLKLKQKIYEAIERNPLDRSAYEEMFAVCREYEKIDFQTAHAWNHELRNHISWGLRMTVSCQKFDEAREFDDLMFRSLLFGAQHFFDDYLQAVEYGKPLDKKFYQPRRHYLRRYVDAYQEILDGKLDFLSISMPKRAGKSQLGINFTNMLSGKYPDRATLMEGTGDDLVKSFYLGCASAMYGYQFYNMQLAARDNGWTPFSAMENHYNLLYREDERELLPICKQMKVSLMPYSPLAAGHLSRPQWKSESLRGTTDRVAMGKYDKTEAEDMQIVKRVAELAEKYNCKMSQIAIAWQWAKGILSPIIGATKTQYLDDSAGAFDIKLTAEDLAYLEEPYVPHEIVGAIDKNPAQGVILLDEKK